MKARMAKTSQIVLPGPALIRPEDGAEYAKFDLLPDPLEPTLQPAGLGLRQGGIAEFRALSHKQASAKK